MIPIDQIGIVATGVVAVYLTQVERGRRYACLFGLAGQPFWFYSTYHAGQWGTFATCFLYALAWARGVWTFWVWPLIIDKRIQNFRKRWQ